MSGDSGSKETGSVEAGSEETGKKTGVADTAINEDCGFEVVDYTADIGIKAHAPDLPRCFAAVAQGMFHIITDDAPVEPRRSALVELEADSIEHALVDFLSELLFLFETEYVLFSDFTVELTRTDESVNTEFRENGSAVSVPSFQVKAICRGEPYDEKKHRYPVEIKAVTHHDLSVVEGPPAVISVLFDI